MVYSFCLVLTDKEVVQFLMKVNKRLLQRIQNYTEKQLIYFNFEGYLAEKQSYKHRGKIMKHNAFLTGLYCNFINPLLGFCRSGHQFAQTHFSIITSCFYDMLCYLLRPCSCVKLLHYFEMYRTCSTGYAGYS